MKMVVVGNPGLVLKSRFSVNIFLSQSTAAKLPSVGNWISLPTMLQGIPLHTHPIQHVHTHTHTCLLVLALCHACGVCVCVCVCVGVGVCAFICDSYHMPKKKSLYFHVQVSLLGHTFLWLDGFTSSSYRPLPSC